ncbi:MAG: M48 family metallopeptidase [Nocardioidaceae bacterium]|nr:M48 family metallopeptidase [Nocardioidaceae bacterium]
MGRQRAGGTGRTALAALIVGGALFVLLAGWLVPWHPVPGGTPAAVAARSVFSQAQIDRAEHFTLWARVWSWTGLAVSLVVSAWLGFSRRAREWAAGLRGPWWLRAVVLVAAVTVVGQVATLPFAAASQQLFRVHGLATATWSAWSVDLLKSTAITVVVTSVGLVLLVGCARRWPRGWPGIAGTALAVLVVVGSFVYPVLIEPMFNQFHPLPGGALRTSIMRIAHEEDVRVDDVLVTDASRRTTELNAYVSGFGSTRRVVLYDNVLKTLPRDQILSIVAHELGHAKHQDVAIGTSLGAAGALFGIGLLGIVVLALERRGWAGVDDPAVVPTVLALVALGMFLSLPVQNAISRKIETRADVTALEVTRAPAPFIAMQRTLALRSLEDPTPPALSQWWFGSHPTVLQRVAIARQLRR